jgi:hypothetical protein
MSLTKSTFAAATTGGSLRGGSLGGSTAGAASLVSGVCCSATGAGRGAVSAGRALSVEPASVRGGSRVSSRASATWGVRWKTPRWAANAMPRPNSATLTTPKTSTRRRPPARGRCGEAALRPTRTGGTRAPVGCAGGTFPGRPTPTATAGGRTARTTMAAAHWGHFTLLPVSVAGICRSRLQRGHRRVTINALARDRDRAVGALFPGKYKRLAARGGQEKGGG